MIEQNSEDRKIKYTVEEDFKKIDLPFAFNIAEIAIEIENPRKLEIWAINIVKSIEKEILNELILQNSSGYENVDGTYSIYNNSYKRIKEIIANNSPEDIKCIELKLARAIVTTLFSVFFEGDE
jgi:hypothetical protein